MVTLRRITSSTDPILEGFPKLYETAFPIEERSDTGHVMRMIDSCPRMHFNAVLDEKGVFSGIAVIWDLDICRYLLYLAVCEDRRNHGLGSEILSLLKSQSELPIIGEVERPINEMNRRRIGFYKRNGFHIETDDPKILNGGHHSQDCVLMLISTDVLDDCEAAQRRVVEIVYRALQGR